MAALNWQMHPAQMSIHKSDALYKAVAAGRRFGKTYLAVMECILEGLKEFDRHGRPLQTDSEVMYMAPTFEQAKGIFWPLLKLLAEPVTQTIHENTGVLTLINGVRIRLKGMDNPDRARGFKLRYAVLDEYADMHKGAWSAIIRPALADVDGGALFIGTPKGKNHFYELFINAIDCERDDDGELEWEAFKFRSGDNPFIPVKALKRMRDDEKYSSELVKQELEADFLAGGSDMFKTDWWKYRTQEPRDGYFVVSVDLAGFAFDKIDKKKVKRDDTAITIVKICKEGWWVKEQISGKWDTRETAIRIINAARSCHANTIGIEKGALMNAVLPYVQDVMAQYRQFFNIEPLSHGNQNKELRIQWALQGRLEKGRLMLNADPSLESFEHPAWVNKLTEQASDFPSTQTHDDCIDSLAYVDQIAKTIFLDMDDMSHHLAAQYDNWEPVDEWAGV